MVRPGRGWLGGSRIASASLDSRPGHHTRAGTLLRQKALEQPALLQRAQECQELVLARLVELAVFVDDPGCFSGMSNDRIVIS